MTDGLVVCYPASCRLMRAAISSPMTRDAVAAGLGALTTWTAPGDSAQTKSWMSSPAEFMA